MLSLSSSLSDGLTFVADLVWPPRCAACDAFVASGCSFCAACQAAVFALPAEVCLRCAEPVEGAVTVCRTCAAQAPPFLATHAATSYAGTLTQALLRFKHGRRRDLARALGWVLAPHLHRAVDRGGIQIVIPVPLHPRRLRARGFNQALALARVALAALRRPRPRLLVDAVVRVRDTAPLGHEPAARRRLRLEGAFAVARPRAIDGRHVLLVDDVMTTGSTLAGCASSLLDSGAASVEVAVLARAF